MEGFRIYCEMTFQRETEQGFAHFKELWNHTLERDALNDPAQRSFLMGPYRWLRGSKTTEDSYRARLDKFIGSALKAKDLQQS